MTPYIDKLVGYIFSLGLPLNPDPRAKNIIYVEGADLSGKPNADKPDQWNDRRMIVNYTPATGWRIIFNVQATTEPGKFYTDHPLNPLGASRIKFGYYKAWRFGLHNGKQPALIQVAPVTVHRDLNKDYMRSKNDPLDTGVFGINQHSTTDGYTPTLVGKHGAGCLVGRHYGLHQTFLAMLKADYRYQADSKNYLFDTIIVDGTKVWNFKPAP